MTTALDSTVPAGNREPAGDVCPCVKIHACDGTYLGSVSSEKAAQIIAADLGEIVNGYVRLFAAAWRGSKSGRELRLSGLRPHSHETRDNPRGVWTFRSMTKGADGC